MNGCRSQIPSYEWLSLCTVGADLVASFWFVNAFEGELRMTERLGLVWGLLGVAVVMFHLVGIWGDTVWRAKHHVRPTHDEEVLTSNSDCQSSHPQNVSSKHTWWNGKLVCGVAAGMGASCLAGWLGSAAYPHWDRLSTVPLIMAASFAAVALLTSRFFTHPDVRPLVVGLRRMCGWLLGMSVAKAVSTAFYEFELSANAAFEWSKKVETWGGFTKSQWCAALAVGVYVAGVTWIRGRSDVSQRSTSAVTTGALRAELVAGMSATLAGIFILIPLPRYLVGLDATFQSDHARWSILIGALALLAFLRNFRAFRSPRATFADGIARQGMLSVIFLDAAICATTGGMLGAATVLMFLIPAFLVDRQSQRFSSC